MASNPFSSHLIIRSSEKIEAQYELINTNGIKVCAGNLQCTETILNTQELKAAFICCESF